MRESVCESVCERVCVCSGTREHTPVRTHTKGLFTLRLTPGKDRFHTCNLKAVLAPHFTRGYETLLRSRVSTAFVVLSPHCGAKFVQCETSGVCLLSCKLQPVRRNIKRWKE